MENKPEIRFRTKSEHFLPPRSHLPSLSRKITSAAQTLMKEEKESHHTVKYRGLKERKRQKAIIKRRQTKRESAKTQHGERRKITNDVLVPGCGIFIPADLTQVHRKKKEEFREKLF